MCVCVCWGRGDWMEELRGELDGRIEGGIGWKN